MFDDFPNLAPLGYWGSIDSLETFRNYVESGFAGPTGRPVSLISFLVDANSWPADPYSFKRTNVLLHLLVGCGVLLFLLKLIGLVYPVHQKTGRVVLACVCVTALWLLHPYWVSTTLYVVQRMAILSALFGIFSILCFLNAREEALREGVVRGPVLCWLILGGVLFVLGVYSKENVVILPICILALEVILQARSPLRSNGWRLLILIGCILPATILLSYFLYRGIQGWDVTDSRRGFTAGERFLAQGKVLWIYVANIFVPQPYTSGLYTEVAGVGGAVNRLQGLVGWLAFVSLIAGGWFLRNRWPLVFLAISLFVVAHLVESTVIPLELYFEHRNYFPGIFLLLLPLQLAFSATVSRSLLWMFSLTALFVFGALLWMRASLWADYPSLVESWADIAPNSVRAQLECVFRRT